LILGVLNNGLDHVEIDSFLKILIRGLILLAPSSSMSTCKALRESETYRLRPDVRRRHSACGRQNARRD